MDETPRASVTERPVGRPRITTGVLVVGTLAVVLVGVDSALFDLERHLAPKTLALHLTAFALLAVGAARPMRALRDPPGLLLLAFVAWSGLSSLLAANRWLALRAWGVSFSALVVFVACRSLARERRWGALAGLAACVVLAAALGAAQAYGVDWPWLADSRAPGGTFGNRNFLAHVAAIAAPGLLVLVLRSRHPARAAAGMVGLAVLAVAVVLTRSRAAWLAGLTGLAVVALTMMWGRWRAARPGGVRALAAAAILAAAVAAAVAVPNRLQWTSDAPYAHTLGRIADYREGSGRGRLVQYRNSLDLVRGRPVLGVGPGNWFVHYPRVTGPGDPAWSGHLAIPTNPWPSSDWVAFVVERGPLGALLLALAGAAACVRAWTATGRGAAADPWAAPALFGTLAAAGVAGAFDAVLLLAAPSFLVWATVGLLLPPAGATVESGGVAPGRGRWPRRAGLAVAAVLVTISALETAAIAVTRERRDADTLERSARLAPWEHRPHLLLGEQGRCDHALRAAALGTLERWREAADAARAGLAASGPNPVLLGQLGKARHELGDLPGAERALLACESCGIDLPTALHDIERKVFMVVAQDFQDSYTLNVRQLMKCCVEEITPDGRLIPFCAYNSVGYREQVRKD
ncbi:MAG: O-antigen ligase family protein, partial [Gemmatimonadetes bacterium]|nr:O-antigen ligase family protein [Gemmatimonadota bacterium]